MNIKSWAVALCFAVLATGCGGGGGGGGGGTSDPPITVTISPSSATLLATTTSAAPVAYLALTATNMPSAGLYVLADNGSRGYVTTNFDGSNLIVTGDTPSTLAVGTYTDTIDVKVCYDDHCARQIPGSPFHVPVSYTIAQADPATATPMLTQLSPSSVAAGGAGFTLTVTGSFFVPTSTIMWNGQVRATTYVSATTLSAQINASDIAYGSSVSVTVSNVSTGGGASSAQQFTVTTVQPAIAALSPPTVVAGSGAFTLTVSGGNFTGTSSVLWNGQARATTYVSDTTLTAQISASDVAFATSAIVTVSNASSGGGSSASQTFPVTALVPSVTSLSPNSAVVGGAGFALNVSGSNFVSSSQVQWNGQSRATTYVSGSMLTAQIGASDIASVGAYPVSVSNAATGGGTSAGQAFTVNPLVPVISSLSPATAATGGSAYTLTVDGSGFDTTSQVMWNGSGRTTTYVSSGRITAQITAADIASSGSVQITVVGQQVGVTTSNAATLTVAYAPLSLASPVPAFVAVGGPAYVETVVGTGFDPTSTVRWNGTARTTTHVSSTQLTVQVSAADIASAGTATVQVVSAGVNPGSSATKSIKIGQASTNATAFQINPQHNGNTTFTTIVGPSAFPSAPTWTATLDGPVSYALIAGGRVFVTVMRSSGGSSELVALSAATGAVVWGPVAVAGPANATFDNGRVIVMSGGAGVTGTLTALDAVTGTQLWTTALPGQYVFSAPPTALNGMVYTSGSGLGGTLYAVDDTSGALMWQAGVANGDDSSPTLTATGVYVTYPCQTYDFNPLTGVLNWSNNTGCSGGGGATGTFANNVYYSPNQPAGYNGMSFDATTGTLKSSYTADLPPAIGATTGYFLQSRILTAIGLSNNAIQWTFAGDGGLGSAPILINGYVFVGSVTGKLYALDATTGAQLWQTALAGGPNTGCCVQLDQSGLSAGAGLLLVPVGNTLSAYTLSTNP